MIAKYTHPRFNILYMKPHMLKRMKVYIPVAEATRKAKAEGLQIKKKKHVTTSYYKASLNNLEILSQNKCRTRHVAHRQSSSLACRAPYVYLP